LLLPLAVMGKECLQATAHVPLGDKENVVCRSGALYSLTEGESRNPQPIPTKDNIESY
jgi:hypothetical protein